MTLKINPIVATLLIAGIIILIVALFKGCHESKLEGAAKENAQKIADSALSVLKIYKVTSDSTAKDFQDSLDFERGQKELAIAQKERTEEQLDASDKQVKQLLEKYKYAKYTDTTAVTVPNEYITNCADCFGKLESQNNLVNKYRSDVKNLQLNNDKQIDLYQQRFKELNAEKLGFTNKITSLLQEQKKYSDKLQPRGRLYLSWGVLFKPWPKYAGAGMMYQNKRNLIIGAMWYYGDAGHMIQTTINFPLSLKF